MLPPTHPEVLDSDWLPPVPIYRRLELERVYRMLTSEAIQGKPRGAVVRGPPGSGTSTVARLAVRSAVEEHSRTWGPGRTAVIHVRVRFFHGVQSIAASLLEQLEPGLNGRGFHISEIMAGFLRRLQRGGQRAFILLDDVAPGAGDLSPILAPLADPARFLPEGADEPPECVVILAGSLDASSAWTDAARLGWSADRRVDLVEYPPAALASILADRAGRALGRPAPEQWLEAVVRRVERHRLGVSAAMLLLRRELTGPEPVSDYYGAGRGPRPTGPIEPHLIAALERVAEHHHATIAELKQWESELARKEGVAPLPTTTFWRRIVRLESVGVVHRAVRTGGAGGTRSIVELLQPVSALWSASGRPDTPRADAWSSAGSPRSSPTAG
jgi:hypothetical protein